MHATLVSFDAILSCGDGAPDARLEVAERAGRRLILVRGSTQVGRNVALSGAPPDLKVADNGRRQPPVEALVPVSEPNDAV